MNSVKKLEEEAFKSELIKSISSARYLLDNIRKRPTLDCKHVTAQIAVDDSTSEINESKLEEAEKRFRTRWQIQKVFKDKEIFIPNDTSTLKLLYGEYRVFCKEMVPKKISGQKKKPSADLSSDTIIQYHPFLVVYLVLFTAH